MIKDYYNILELPPSAGLPEIKKAYRRLAQAFHPDKNNNDPWSQSRFAEIKEAYEVLTDPRKKEYYLQQRWYQQSTGRKKTKPSLTPVSLLKESLELERYIATLDEFRMDKEGLTDYMLGMLDNETIDKIRAFGEPEISRQVISILLRTTTPLTAQQSQRVMEQLGWLAGNDHEALAWIATEAGRRKKKDRSRIFTFVFVILLTLSICVLIWLAGR